MDVAVARIVGAAAEDALPFGLAPGRSGADFVDRDQGSNLRWGTELSWQHFFGSKIDRIDAICPTQGQAFRRFAGKCKRRFFQVIIPSAR
jgi:hypothetical protein